MTIQPPAALPEKLVIGVLGKLALADTRPKLTITALQGAFIEHIHYVERYVPFNITSSPEHIPITLNPRNHIYALCWSMFAT